MSKNRRHIDFTSKDIDQLETYKICLGIEDIKIGSKQSGAPRHSTYYRVQLCYARKDSRKLFDAMFYEVNIPNLHRKFAKAQKIFTMNGL